MVSEEFEGEIKTFEFVYRSPIDWLKSIVTDPTLAPFIAWHPHKKFLFRDGYETPMYDEPCTGERWWNIQVGLISRGLTYKYTTEHHLLL